MGLWFKNTYYARMSSSSAKGSDFRLIDVCITQLQARESCRRREDLGPEVDGRGALVFRPPPVRVSLGAQLVQLVCQLLRRLFIDTLCEIRFAARKGRGWEPCASMTLVCVQHSRGCVGYACGCSQHSRWGRAGLPTTRGASQPWSAARTARLSASALPVHGFHFT